ncbi:unnamed protein product [Cuscuta europaea]|uniref:Uncharacterized protein n=1 Tax=Cuscuta europaea TaxID=41803 RepID=A0A9P0YMA0_CUSEU|nr:unnamed protein product [Cuscuta europaea]
MARKKQGSGESSVIITRSRFASLEDMDVDFPVLNSANKLPEKRKMDDQPAKGVAKILNSEERTKGVQIETEIVLATAGVSANVPGIVGLGILDKPGSSSMIPERLVAKNLLVIEMQDSRVEPNW